MRVLIVDDNAEFLAAASRLLARNGFEVVAVASTGADALRSSQLYHPDVILVDVELGCESGFDVVERLGLTTDQGSIILISGYAQQDVEELLQASCAIGFVSKPQLSTEVIIELLGDGISPAS